MKHVSNSFHTVMVELTTTRLLQILKTISHKKIEFYTIILDAKKYK